MSGIVIMDAPTRRRGRQRRLSDEAIKDLADAVRAGHWAGDNEPVDKDSCAWQRAQSAANLLREFHSVEARTSIRPTDTGKFLWLVGPRTPAQTPEAETEAAA